MVNIDYRKGKYNNILLPFYSGTWLHLTDSLTNLVLVWPKLISKILLTPNLEYLNVGLYKGMFLVIPLLIRHAAFLIINEAKALRKQFRTEYFPFINEPQFFITINHSHKVIPVVYPSFIIVMS